MQNNITKALCSTIWEINSNGDCYLISSDDSEFNYFLSKDLERISELNVFFLMSENDFNKWFKMMLNPPIDFIDISKIAPENIVLADQSYQLFFFQKENSTDFYLMAQNVTGLKFLTSKQNKDFELTQIVKNISKNRIFFYTFLSELKIFMYNLKILIAHLKIEDDSLTELFEKIHTIKGTCGIFGIYSIEQSCQDMEHQYLLRQQDKISNEDFKLNFTARSKELMDNYHFFNQTITKIFGLDIMSNNSSESIAKRELIEFSSRILDNELKEKFKSQFLKKTISDCLTPFNDLISYVSEDTGKMIHKIIFGQGCKHKVNAEYFFYLTNGIGHVFKNAAIHGIEFPEVRIEKGKEDFGKIIVDVEQTKDGFYLIVSDDGKGIPENEINNIFKEHASSNDSHDKHAGLGLGLSAFKKHIETYGGNINVESTVNKGTSFKVYIPQKDFVDSYIEENKRHSNCNLINLRKIDSIVSDEDLVLGSNESTLEILLKCSTYQFKIYKDINSKADLKLFKMNEYPKAQSPQEILEFIHDYEEAKSIKKISVNSSIQDIFHDLESLFKKVKGSRRSANKIKMFIDELYTNAITISKEFNKDEIYYAISMSDSNIRISFLDLVGKLNVNSSIKNISKVIDNGFEQSIVQDRTGGAGIGLSLLLSQSELYSNYIDPNQLTVVTVETPFSTKKRVQLQNIILISKKESV